MEELRLTFCKKIDDEYMQFRNALLTQKKEDIFEAAYKIEIFMFLYEILIEKSEELSGAALKNLITLPRLLEVLYSYWLKKEDGWFEELALYVESELYKTVAVLGSG